ncbi:unnamed protein product [Rotaria magnacalcarata]
MTPWYYHNVGARICARVFGEEKVINNDIEEFTYSAITSLRTSLNLNGLLLFDSCMESNIEPDPREIHINGEWNYQALKASLEDPPQYRLHVLLGTIKLLHEFFHYLKPLTETPPDTGKQVITRVSTKRGQKSTRFIGDMGFAMEEILFGGQRIFFIFLDKMIFTIRKRKKLAFEVVPLSFQRQYLPYLSKQSIQELMYLIDMMDRKAVSTRV